MESGDSAMRNTIYDQDYMDCDMTYEEFAKEFEGYDQPYNMNPDDHEMEESEDCQPVPQYNQTTYERPDKNGFEAGTPNDHAVPGDQTFIPSAITFEDHQQFVTDCIEESPPFQEVQSKKKKRETGHKKIYKKLTPESIKIIADKYLKKGYPIVATECANKLYVDIVNKRYKEVGILLRTVDATRRAGDYALKQEASKTMDHQTGTENSTDELDPKIENVKRLHENGYTQDLTAEEIDEMLEINNELCNLLSTIDPEYFKNFDEVAKEQGFKIHNDKEEEDGRRFVAILHRPFDNKKWEPKDTDTEKEQVKKNTNVLSAEELLNLSMEFSPEELAIAGQICWLGLAHKIKNLYKQKNIILETKLAIKEACFIALSNNTNNNNTNFNKNKINSNDVMKAAKELHANYSEENLKIHEIEAKMKSVLKLCDHLNFTDPRAFKELLADARKGKRKLTFKEKKIENTTLYLIW